MCVLFDASWLFSFLNYSDALTKKNNLVVNLRNEVQHKQSLLDHFPVDFALCPIDVASHLISYCRNCRTLSI
jgi:hypothetical protein